MFDYYDTLITPEEVADMLNCGMNTTYKLLKTGKIKAMRIGRVWKIPKRAVQEYIVQEAHMKAAGFRIVNFPISRLVPSTQWKKLSRLGNFV